MYCFEWQEKCNKSYLSLINEEESNLEVIHKKLNSKQYRLGLVP